MKNDFNRVTKSDMPLDSDSVQSRSSSATKPKTTETKPKITKIGSGTAKKTPAKTATKTPVKTTTTKTTVTKTTTKTVKTPILDKPKSKKDEPKSVAKVDGATKSKTSKKLTDDKISNQDLEKLNEEKIQSHSFRSTRNKVIIVMLVVLILISIIGIVLYSMTLKSDANCFLYMNKKGNVDAVYIVENQQMTEFRTPNGISGNRKFEVDINLKISSGGEYKISYYYECYVGNELMQNVVPYEPNRDLFKKNRSNNTFESIEPIRGYQTIDIIDGVVIDSRYVNRVNANNFKFKLYLTIEKV